MTHPNVQLTDLDAERAVLGAVLLEGDVLDDVTEILAAADFSDERHRQVFEAMISLRMEGKGIDAITIADALKGRSDQVAVRTYVSGLDVGLASSVNAGHYAEILKRLAVRRAVEKAANTVADLAHDGNLSPTDLHARSEQAILGVSRGAEVGLVRISDALAKTIARVEERDRSTAAPGIMSGLARLDRLTQGMRPSELVILAARVGMGKSALATNWATSAALAGGTVAIFSLEMSTPEILHRMLSARATVDGQRFRGGGEQRITPDEWTRIVDESATLSKLNLYLDASPTVTPAAMATKLRRLKNRQGRLDLVVVDYLQLMDAASRSGSRAEDVAGISRALKHLAKDLDVPVLALAQLSREVEKKARRPLLSDLRESGAIEQDADAVIFIHADDESTGDVELIVGKQRNGPTGSVVARFEKQYSRFTEADQPSGARDGGEDL